MYLLHLYHLGLTYECLEEWGPFVKLGVYGIVMLCLDWWCFEMTIFLSGILGTTELGAQGVVFNIAVAFVSVSCFFVPLQCDLMLVCFVK